MTDEAEPSERVRLAKLTAGAKELRRDELVDLHKLMVEEYRFEVALNWQRTQYYLALNVGIIAAAVGLLKVGSSAWTPFVAVLFGVGFATARIARRATRRGHEYYRRASYKKTLVEHLLGRLDVIEGFNYKGASLAIATTRGMQESEAILDDPEKFVAKPTASHTVTAAILQMMLLLMIVNGAGALLCIVVAIVDAL